MMIADFLMEKKLRGKYNLFFTNNCTIRAILLYAFFRV
jgi:hypothetical protein